MYIVITIQYTDGAKTVRRFTDLEVARKDVDELFGEIIDRKDYVDEINIKFK